MPLGPSSSQWYPSAQVMIAQVFEREFKLAASTSESGVRVGVVAVGIPSGGPGVKIENGVHLAVRPTISQNSSTLQILKRHRSTPVE